MKIMCSENSACICSLTNPCEVDTNTCGLPIHLLFVLFVWLGCWCILAGHRERWFRGQCWALNPPKENLFPLAVWCEVWCECVWVKRKQWTTSPLSFCTLLKSRFDNISVFGKREPVVKATRKTLQPYRQTVQVVHAVVSFVNADLMSLGLYLYS